MVLVGRHASAVAVAQRDAERAELCAPADGVADVGPLRDGDAEAAIAHAQAVLSVDAVDHESLVEEPADLEALAADHEARLDRLRHEPESLGGDPGRQRRGPVHGVDAHDAEPRDGVGVGEDAERDAHVILGQVGILVDVEHVVGAGGERRAHAGVERHGDAGVALEATHVDAG